MSDWLTLQSGKRVKRCGGRARFRIMLAQGDRMVSAGRRCDYDAAVAWLQGQERGGYVVEEDSGEVLSMKVAIGGTA